jgi:hypothetical protein
MTWTVDTVAPEAAIDAAPPDPTSSRAATIEFHADEAATFECRLDDGAWAGCSSPHGYTGLADGGHTFEVRATDSAGNVGAATSTAWTVDATAPNTTIDSGPADPTHDRAASFEFHAGETATFECRLDGGVWAGCASPESYTGLADGRHMFEVRATDAAGNQEAEPASYAWTVDTVAPTTTIHGGPADPSNDSAPSLTFSAGETATFECRLDEAPWAGCSSPQAYFGLPDGRHTFSVRATDRAGNPGSIASRTWTVDTVAPHTVIDSGPSDPSRTSAPSFEFHAGETATFECRLDEGAWAGCSSPQSYAELADGRHTFQVRATDGAGNGETEPASYSWTVDATAPNTTIDGGPADPTHDRAARFEFHAGETATFECRLDGGAWAGCASPQSYTGLADGRHTFEVRATDAAGNQEAEPASYGWMIEPPRDATPPDTSITAAPANPSNSSSATFQFAGTDNETAASTIAFECRLDSQQAAGFGSCSNPKTYANVSDGSHTFDVRAVDLAGNADPTPASFTWTVDTTAPQTTITSAPPATTSSMSASFSFAAGEPGSTFECSLDGAPYASCTSPRSYTGLGLGGHQFSVRARDAAGNADASPASHSWTIAAPPGCGPAATANASADAWIDENSPANNKGGDSILKVQSKGPRDNFRALVRFGLPAVPQGCVVQSSTLRLYAASARTGRTLHALRLASAWSENQVTWSNQPLTTGSAAATPSALGYLQWDVTSQVLAMYGGSNHGFLIRDSVEGQDAEQQFHAREKGENPPQLVVRFAAAGG